MKPRVSLRQALSDPNLLGHALPGASWRVWRTLLIAATGGELNDEERATFRRVTGREHEPGQCVAEFAAAVGRRGGKSHAVGALAAWLSGLCDYSDVLVRGEVGTLLCVALDQKVATIVMNHVVAAFEDSPILKQMIASRTQDTLTLTNGISVEVRAASFRKLRGPTYIAVIADELAFWYQDSSYANPDVEILNAVRPGLLTTRGILVLVSSVYGKRGVLWDTYRRHYGPDGSPSVLVAHGTSRDFNPTLPQAEIDRALEADYARNSAEYLSIWRSDIESYVAIEVVEACVGDHREMLPAANTLYKAFVDPASGSGDDSFTLAIGHKAADHLVIDAIREIRPYFSPSAAVEDLSALLLSYKIFTVCGDHYAGEFPRELFRKHGIYAYEPCKLPKSDLFRDLLPLLNSGHIRLPRNDKLVAQIVGLERKVTRAGKESIDHGPHGHDDLANAVAGCAMMLRTTGYSLFGGALDHGSDAADREVKNEIYRKQFAARIFAYSGGRLYPR
jgi:hypothetical protein